MESPTQKNEDDMDTKENFPQAALKIFAANGYHGSSVADIAKEAKISKSLYNIYFPSFHL